MLESLNALDDVLQQGGYWREGTYRHVPGRGAIPVKDAHDEEYRTLSCLRTELVAGILQAMERQWGANVKIHWDCPITKMEVLPQQPEGEETCVVQLHFKNDPVPLSKTVHLVVCADGSSSAVGRPFLAAAEPDFQVKLSPSGVKAKTLLFQHTQDWIPTQNSLHFIQPATKNQPSSFLLLGRHTGPRASDAVGADMIQTMMVYPDQHELDQATSRQTLKRILYESFTKEQIPLTKVISDEELARCAASRGATLPGTVSCNRYHSGHVVVIGDAAHQAPTNSAQGVNCALEDAWILSRLLTTSNSTVPETLAQFTSQRKPDAEALQRMMNHPFFASVRPSWRNIVVSQLYETTGVPALKPLSTQVSGSRLTYQQCERNMLVQYHLPVVLAVVSTVVLGWLVWLLFEQVHNLWLRWQSTPIQVNRYKMNDY